MRMSEICITVCKLTAGTFGWTLLSASWDQTARGWREDGSEWVSATFGGHSAAVWSVCQLPSGFVVTASADKTLRVFGESGDYQRQLKGEGFMFKGNKTQRVGEAIILVLALTA